MLFLPAFLKYSILKIRYFVIRKYLGEFLLELRPVFESFEDFSPVLDVTENPRFI